MKKLSFLIAFLVLVFSVVAHAQDDLLNRQYYSVGEVGQVPDANTSVTPNEEYARLPGLVKNTDGTICRPAGVPLAGNQCTAGVIILGPGGAVSINPIDHAAIPDDGSENAMKVHSILHGWSDDGAGTTDYFSVGMTRNYTFLTKTVSDHYDPLHVVSVPYMSQGGTQNLSALIAYDTGFIPNAQWLQGTRSIQYAVDRDNTSNALEVLGDEYNEVDITNPNVPFGTFSSGMIYGHHPQVQGQISAPTVHTLTSGGDNWTNSYIRWLRTASVSMAVDSTSANIFKPLTSSDLVTGVSAATDGLYTLSTIHARDADGASAPEPLDFLETHQFDNKPAQIKGLVTTAYLYARDSTGTQFDALGISDAGNLETMKAEILPFTPGSGTPTAVDNTVTTVLASQDINLFTNICLYLRNLGGGSGDDLSDAIIEVSPFGSNWAPLVWTSCDGLSSGNMCVRCISGNGYRYVRLRAQCGVGEDTTILAYITGNNG
jgi:hypothetical protein